MTSDRPAGRVRQLRLVVEVQDVDEAARFFRDALGLAVEGDHTTGEARVVILQAGRATLELANPAQRAYIDRVEVGRDVAPRFRVAFEVDEVDDVTEDLVAGGATLVAAPTLTPWRSRNARFDTPGELHVTIFEELA